MEGSPSSSSPSIPITAWLTLLQTSSSACVEPMRRDDAPLGAVEALGPTGSVGAATALLPPTFDEVNNCDPLLRLALVYRPLPSTHSLSLVVAVGEECHPDTIPCLGNVLGKWLHVMLFVSEVAFELLVISW